MNFINEGPALEVLKYYYIIMYFVFSKFTYWLDKKNKKTD